MGTISCQEILEGCKTYLNVWLDQEQSELFIKWVDKEGNNTVNLKEFKKAIDLSKLAARESKYFVSELSFIKLINRLTV
jgi:Ca2+-binding EF-hand superfamily protein